MIERRTFLKLGAALGLVRYAEPLQALAERGSPLRSEWVEDRGDFLVVRVPAFQTFADARLPKPTLFLLGEQAVVSHVRVLGFANVSAPNAGRITDCTFDASECAVARERAVLEFSGNGGQIFRNTLIPPPSIDRDVLRLGLSMQNTHDGLRTWIA